MIKKLLEKFKLVDEQQRKPPPKFNHKVRKDSEKMSDKEKRKEALDKAKDAKSKKMKKEEK